MRNRILEKAKEDIPLYFNDFKTFWDKSIDEISDDDLYEAYRATLVFKNWKITFHSLGLVDFDKLLDELYEDLNSSLFLALQGLYRSSHMHMRSSIELSLQLLYFIHHPIEYKKWETGDFVIKHADLIEYMQTHPNFDIDLRQFLETITKLWKHFSKHIHGESPVFFQCEKDVRKTNDFSEKDFSIWLGNLKRNIYRINKLLLLFFKNDLNRFPESSRNILLSILNDSDLELLNVE